MRDLGAPERVIASWPADIGLLALVSGGDPGGAWSRWSVLARGGGRVVGADETDGVRSGSTTMARDPDAPPFVGGWIGWVGYDAGTRFEPSARHPSKAMAPLSGRGRMTRCDAAYVHDRMTGRWFACGVHARAIGSLPDPGELRERTLDFRAGPLRSVEGREAYERAVARAVEYVHAGDVFQANIAHRMRCDFDGSRGRVPADARGGVALVRCATENSDDAGARCDRVDQPGTVPQRPISRRARS